MTAYSPGDSTAWGSVYFIQYEMDFGWLIRGLHHFGSQTMVVLLGCSHAASRHRRAHLPPREFNWWLGLGLMGIVLGLSLTGYLLPWDQKGFFATQVATNILGSLPGVGSFLQKVVVGGPVYGNHTLTHFYSLHVGILPPLLIVLLIAHVAIFRRHGITTPPGAQGERNRPVLARSGVPRHRGLPGGFWRHAGPGGFRRPRHQVGQWPNRRTRTLRALGQGRPSGLRAPTWTHQPIP